MCVLASVAPYCVSASFTVSAVHVAIKSQPTSLLNGERNGECKKPAGK